MLNSFNLSLRTTAITIYVYKFQLIFLRLPLKLYISCYKSLAIIGGRCLYIMW